MTTVPPVARWNGRRGSWTTTESVVAIDRVDPDVPTASNGDVALYYERDGEGEPVVFVPEAGLGGWSWGWQHAALAGPFETIVPDLRGTGRSDAPPGPYDCETLAGDLEAILADQGVRNAHVVGAGLGGAIALEYARSFSRVETLALFGTAPRGEAYALEPLFAPPDDRGALRRSLETALSADFRAEQPDVVEGIVDWRADGDAERAGWTAQVAAIRGFDASEWLVEVTRPTLVVHGTADAVVPLEAGRTLADGLPRSEFLGLEGAGHLCFVERSRPTNDRLRAFLASHSIDGER